MIAGPHGHVMGIVNLTPDSFSDGGLVGSAAQAAAAARAMVGAGAVIVDLGAESTRPGAAPVDAEEEQRRLLPALAAIREAVPDTLISVDTYRAETARRALDADAHIVNDVWGLQRDAEMANAVAEAGAGVVIMHTGRDRDVLADPIDDQIAFLSRSLEIALAAGIAEEAIMLDPGFGFAKDPECNVTLMARFEELHQLGFPLLAGASRKRFLGHFTGRDVDARDVATAATTALLRAKGAAVLRVHDVASNVDAVRITDAMIAADPTLSEDVGTRHV